MKNRTILICILLAFLFNSPLLLKGQSADEKIGTLINENNYFELDKQFAVLKDSMRSDMLRLMAEGLLYHYFNKPKEANKTIGKLITNYQNEMGFENSLSMTGIVLKNLLTMEKYDDAIKASSSLIEQIKPYVDSETTEGFRVICNMATDLQKYEPTRLTRSDSEVEVPLTIEKVGRGELMFVPVSVNGKEKSFIFDTGCAAMNYVSEEFAEELNIRLISDSLYISGVGGSGYGWIGIADSMNVGDITYYNPLFIVAPPMPTDTVYKVNAVLGAGFLNAVGEVQIFANDNKIVFPVSGSAIPTSGRNMLLHEGQPYVKTYADGEQLIFHLDTGNTKSTLFNRYYLRHKDLIMKTGKKSTSTSGGFGGIETKEVYEMPTFAVWLDGDKPARLKDVEVEIHNEGFQGWQSEDGSLGMDFLRAFEKVTINYRDMFVTAE